MFNQGTLKGEVDLLFDRINNVRLCSTKFSEHSTEAHF